MVSGPAHLANLDLNLLVMLRELIRERNVTRAAERVGVTQPAASAALSRLRRHFGDELLVRGKGGYTLSPLAAQLAEQVEIVCSKAERLFATGTHFDPLSSQREFTLLVADYTIAVMGTELVRLVAREAPGVRLHLRMARESLASDVADTIHLIDGMVAPPASRFRLSGLRSVELFRDRWVCVVSEGNRLLRANRPTLEQLASLPWVAPFHDSDGYPPAAPLSRQLTLFGIRPHVAVRVESYQAVPSLVAGTDRVALIQERLAATVAPRLGLRILECPGDPEPIVEKLWWHSNYEADPAHRWLRDTVSRAAERLPAP
ncbi:DNA-binding transcriptional LysR family regulator [Saccharomonospora amisosensis]|uniref:DNA-binding transcriptional LysR family regulator n=1 Tax=Saccharomonospora amisosensis TaxID=1128677 RepID=A0A7X5UPC3_9PSEU|nr:LysR family transcriptional regulator [Saccharomonospora amisosensis]NIJ11324.1 DNA-binding transcriptional LysR family regulator [Saccharomonospora amisosensis]